MEHYKTFRIGTDETPDQFDEIVLFDKQTIWSHCDVISKLSNPFWKSGFLYQQQIKSGPSHIKILIPYYHKSGVKINPTNKNTSIETIEWFLNNMVPPPGGIVFSLFFYENRYPGIGNSFYPETIWPLKQTWIGDGDYVTIQRFEPLANSKRVNEVKNAGHYELIQNFEKYCPYPVKDIVYRNGEQYNYELLLHSKRHFTYHTGSYYLAGMIDTPTVAFGFPIGIHPFEGGLYDMMEPETETPKGGKRKILYEKSFWRNSSPNPPMRIYHLDQKSNLCIQKPQAYVRHAWDKEELLGYITFSKDLEIVNRNRQDWTDITDLPLA